MQRASQSQVPSASWWVLGFPYEAVVESWQDARMAQAYEVAWRRAACPDVAQVRVVTSSDDYPFRWYLNEAATRLLDQARINWRQFLIGHAERVPSPAADLVVST